MKKTLIAALIAGIPAVAAADVTVYGIIKGGVETVDMGGDRTQTGIDDLGSRIGFKGAEDLGNGLKAIWQIETGIDIDNSNGSNNWASRQSFIGLSGDYGTVRLGNLSTFADTYSQIDAWEYASPALGLSAFTRDHTRIKNAVRYDAPEIAGLKATVLYGANEERNGPVAIDGPDYETYNLGLNYDYGNFYGQYSYTYRSAAGTAVDTDDHQVEIGYNANNLFVAAGYKQTKGALGDTTHAALFEGLTGTELTTTPALTKNEKAKSQEYALTVAYTMGNFTPKFSFAYADDMKVDGKKVDNTDFQQYLLGVDYAMSKRTIVGATYGHVKLGEGLVVAGNDDSVNAFGVSMIHKF